MLLEIPNVLTPDELRGLSQGLAKLSYSDGRLTAGNQAVLQDRCDYCAT